MALTAEQFETLLRTLGSQNGSQYSILVFCGIIAMAGMLLVVWFVLNMRLKPVDKLESRMEEMQKMLNSMNAKMWSQETLDDRIDNRIHEYIRQHERECLFRKNGASN